MRQVVLTAPKQIEFREVAAPEAGNLKSDEVLLRILRIGICGSEIHSYHGQHPATFYPVVQGHEYSAEVVAVGSAVRKVKPGDRVRVTSLSFSHIGVRDLQGDRAERSDAGREFPHGDPLQQSGDDQREHGGNHDRPRGHQADEAFRRAERRV